jgi:FkbM family methyltransferase
MQIFYGTPTKQIDVTEVCLSKTLRDGIIRIPSGDNARAHIFGDPVYGIVKKIFVHLNNQIHVVDDYSDVSINVSEKTMTTRDEREVNGKLALIQNSLKLKYGSFQDELPEQKMVTRYLTGKEKVLEIGGNIGRNSLVISSLLETTTPNTNFVCLESDIISATQLIENRNINNLNFHVENAALSKRKLIQHGWNTIPSDVVLSGYKEVKTITWQQLLDKYQIPFDTLVLDCEGAFYFILMDMPEILNNIKLVVMENDYTDITRKQYVDKTLTDAGFVVDYIESGGWGCCYSNFFEVWVKK